MDRIGSSVTNRVRIGSHTVSDVRRIASHMDACIHTRALARGATGDLHAGRPRFSAAPIAVRPLAHDGDGICRARLPPMTPSGPTGTAATDQLIFDFAVMLNGDDFDIRNYPSEGRIAPPLTCPGELPAPKLVSGVSSWSR